MIETLRIKDLSQLKLLSDPLKLRLLQSFAETPGTAKMAAEALGEPVTKLYRHVDALHEAGLLEVVGERQKRGTVERTFGAIARRFEVDHSVFQGDDAGATGSETIRSLLESGIEEILTALSTAQTANTDAQSRDEIDAPKDPEDIILTRVRLRGTPERIAKWRASLALWLEEVQADEGLLDDRLPDETGLENAGALIAFYPLEAVKTSDEPTKTDGMEEHS